MTVANIATGREERARLMRAAAPLIIFAAVASAFVNLLMLTGPLFMLQVYDRVLTSRSEETLVTLTLLVAFLFVIMGLLDWARAQAMARVGARFQSCLDGRLFDSTLAKAVSDADRTSGQALSDLAAVRQFLCAPVLIALFDMPFAPLFAVMIFLFHPLLGMVAFAGGGILILMTALNQWTTRRHGAKALRAASEAEALAAGFLTGAEAILGMGMGDAARERWQRLRRRGLWHFIAASDRAAALGAATRSFRLFLQSAMLSAGAWLVLHEQLSAGAMVAASILLGRALAPVEQLLAGWPLAQQALAGWRRLARQLAATPRRPPRTRPPVPRARLGVRDLVVIPPGERRPALSGITLELEPGQALGVIGPSAAGKSTLARVVVGLWPASAGRIVLDGAGLAQYPPDALGRHIGYLPQSVRLFRGTIAENIARMALCPDPEAVVAAARMAGAHEMITALDEGYDTLLGDESRLSGGQRQLVGLARALYGAPKLLVLDEPDANLDSVGSARVNAAIRAMKERGGAVIVIAHRPAAIAECELLLTLDAGRQRAFGPRECVLGEQVRNSAEPRARLTPVARP
jgi:ATP-binding cassette subfamily C protein